LARAELGRLVGGGAALAFAVTLLASGLSSSSVGTYAGQVVMRGFIRRRMPVFLRRALTMLPAFVVLALRLPATDSLVISQVVLSFGIPFALVPLVWLTGRADVMGPFVNSQAHQRRRRRLRPADRRAQRLPLGGSNHLMSPGQMSLTAKPFNAFFQRLVQRPRPLPVGSRLMTVRWR
jgi:hypothetical protein